MCLGDGLCTGTHLPSLITVVSVLAARLVVRVAELNVYRSTVSS